MSKLVKIRYSTTARGPHYRHDEGQEVEVELKLARQLVEDGLAQAVDPADLVEEAEPEVDQKKAEPETAELRPTEKAVAPPQERVGPQRRPADHKAERPTSKG